MQKKQVFSLVFLSLGSICSPAYSDAYLTPHHWSLQAQGGVNPIVWGNKDNSYWVNGKRLPSFLTLFDLPWMVGIKAGYHVNGYTEIYLEGDYTQADGKSLRFSATNPINGPSNCVAKPSRYRAIAIYGAARHYFGNFLGDSSCRASFFVGFKVGFVHHNDIRVSITETNESEIVFGPFDYRMVSKNYTISAGGNLGLDVKVIDCLSIVLTVEVIGNGPARSSTISASSSPLNAISSHSALAGYNIELWFPATLGLKYNF